MQPLQASGWEPVVLANTRWTFAVPDKESRDPRWAGARKRQRGAQVVRSEQQGLEERQLCLPARVRRLACTMLGQGSRRDHRVPDLLQAPPRPPSGPVCSRVKPAYSQVSRHFAVEAKDAVSLNCP